MYGSMDEDWENDSSNMGSNTSGTVNITSNICGFIGGTVVPITLIICGALLASKPQPNSVQGFLNKK
jgi:hypothetical protein